MLLRLTALLIPIVLVGCSPVEATVDTQVPKREARAQRARDALAQPPKVSRRTMQSGEFVTIEVPVDLGHGFVDTQRCFLWRDSEFRTATMQCPSDSAPALEGPAPEARYRP